MGTCTPRDSQPCRLLQCIAILRQQPAANAPSTRVECEREQMGGSRGLRESRAQSGLAATFVPLLGPGFVIALRNMNQQKATGLAATAGHHRGTSSIARYGGLVRTEQDRTR